MSFIIDTRVETNFKKIVAGKERILPEVHLVKTVGSQAWSISALEIKRTSKIVAQQIIEGNDNITYEELEFLKNLYSVSYLGLSRIVDVDEKRLMKRRKMEGIYNTETSWKIRNYFSSIISYDFDSSKINTKLKSRNFKVKKTKLSLASVSLIALGFGILLYFIISSIVKFL